VVFAVEAFDARVGAAAGAAAGVADGAGAGAAAAGVAAAADFVSFVEADGVDASAANHCCTPLWPRHAPIFFGAFV
jgi:hypothetical protein